MDKKQKQGCLWAAAGCLVVAIMVGVAVIGGGAWFAYQNFSLAVDKTSETSAEEEFARLRARFAGQQPLLRVGEHGRTELVPRASKGGQAEWLHIIAFDPDKGELARLKLPFWLLRLTDDGKVSFGEHVRGVDVQLTAKDIDAAGPGLILDHEDRGHRVVIWAE